MKKIFCIIGIIILFTCGCSSSNTENKEENKNLSDLPNHHLYYVKTDYQKNTNNIIDINVYNGDNKTILTTSDSVFKLKYDNDKLYAIFNNRVGYVDNKQIKYITTTEEYVSRYDVHNGKIYYGKDNSNASDNIFERFAVKDINGENEKIINEAGVSQLVVDDYIYYKADSGTDVDKLLRYNLDGTNKTVIYDSSTGHLIKAGDSLYFVNYTDSSSIYKINKDGSGATKILEGTLSFSNFKANPIDGYSNMGVIDNYLYYVNSKDNNKLYKTDGTNNEKVIDNAVSNIYIVDNYIYCSYKDTSKLGIYLFDKNGKELKKVTDNYYYEYIVK